MQTDANSQQPLVTNQDKPTFIKVLQMIDLGLFILSIPGLLLGLAFFYDPNFACGEDKICGNVIFYNSVVISFSLFAGLGVYSLSKYTAKLKIVGILSSIAPILLFLYFLLTRARVF